MVLHLAFAVAHQPVLCGGVLADQRVAGGAGHQLGEIVGAGDVARVEACAVGEMGAPHAEHAGLGVHRLDKGAATAGVVSRQGRGGPVFRRHQGDVQHVGAAEAGAYGQAGTCALDPVHIVHGDGEHLVEALVAIQHHQRRHQLGDGGDCHHPIGVAFSQDLPGSGVGDHEGIGSQGEIGAWCYQAVGGGRGRRKRVGMGAFHAGGKEEGAEQQGKKRTKVHGLALLRLTGTFG
ncbi:hypothetical protein D3C72_1518680 [compost metagenome]